MDFHRLLRWLYLEAASITFDGGFYVCDLLTNPLYELWTSGERAMAELMRCNNVAVGLWCDAAMVLGMLTKLHDLCV